MKHKLTFFLPTLAVFFVALALRLIYFSHLKTNPFFAQVLESCDQHAFIACAVDIVQQGPSAVASFSRAPLYPLLMGGVFKVFGVSLPAMRLVQLVMGAGSCVLVFWVGRLAFSAGVGVAAGLIAAMYPVSLFYEGLLLRAAFAAQMNLALLAVLLFALHRRRTMWWLLSGVCFGLGLLVRPNILLFLPFMLWWIWFVCKKASSPSAVRAITAAVAGTACVLVAMAGLNLFAGAAPLSISKVGSYNFYIGNAPDALGYGYFVPESYAYASREHLVREALDAAWHNPGASLELMGRKLLAFVNGYEYPNNMNFYLFQEFSWVLRNPVLSFAVLSPVGLLGLLLCFRRSQGSLLLSLFFASGFFSVWLFFVTSRFRYPLAPILFVFAAVALFRVGDMLLKKEYIKIVIALIAAVPLTVAAIPRPLAGGCIRPEDLLNLGLVYQRQEHYVQAIQSYNRVLALLPGNPQARFHLSYCTALEAQKQNRYGQAAAAFKEALDIEPQDDATRYNFFSSMGMYLLQQSNYSQAAKAFSNAVALQPDNLSARNNYYFSTGRHALQQQRYAEAAEAFEKVLTIRPGNKAAKNDLEFCRSKIVSQKDHPPVIPET